MDRQALLKKLDAMLEDCGRREFWGAVEIEFRKGVPVLLKKHTSEKLNLEENPGAHHQLQR